MNHGIRSVHLRDRAVVRREIRLVLGEATFLLDLDLDRIAKVTEHVRDTAEEDGWADFHSTSIIRLLSG
jgi:hypothetical protein